MGQATKVVHSAVGQLGALEGDESASQLTLRLENGQRVRVAREHLQKQPDGSMLFVAPLETLVPDRTSVTVPIVEEQLTVEKVQTPRGSVVVHVIPTRREETVSLPLSEEQLDVRHVEIRRLVDAVPAIREEGDTVIVPVMEEVLVVEKRLMLREEIHVVRRRSTRTTERHVTLRSEEVEVTRTEQPR